MIYRMLTFAGALLVLALSASAQGTIVTPTQLPPRTIAVTGIADRQVPPDTALVVLAVETQAETVARAVAQNNTLANRVMDAVRNLRIPNLTIRTLGFDVQPIYEQPVDGRPINRPLRIIAYRVVNRVEARIPSTNPDTLSTNVGNVLDAGLSAGANRVDSVSFILENDQPVLREALAEATRNARETAAAMANAAGVQLGQLLNLSTTPFYPQPPIPLYARAEAAMGGGVPIVAGPMTIEVTVTALYEIR